MNAPAPTRQAPTLLVNVGFMVAGIIWIAVVVLFTVYALDRAHVVAGQGLMAEPGAAQMVVAYLSAAIFALPGALLVYYGLSRQRRAGRS